MADSTYIRIWKEIELDDIQKHLLITGDPLGDCANCKEVGINISSAKVCPKCGTEFKYISTRLKSNPSQARKMKQKRPELIAVELSDFKEACARRKAQKFMKD